MQAWPARVLTQNGVWRPTNVWQPEDSTVVYVDKRNGQRVLTLIDVTIEHAPTEEKDRRWIVSGFVDGDATTVVVEFERGCGCGSTSLHALSADDAAALAAVTVTA